MRVKWRNMLLAAATAVTVPQAALAQSTEVVIDSGAISGSAADGVVSWKGIPFAEPPLGDLRWRAPQPVKPWQSVRETTDSPISGGDGNHEFLLWATR